MQGNRAHHPRLFFWLFSIERIWLYIKAILSGLRTYSVYLYSAICNNNWTDWSTIQGKILSITNVLILVCSPRAYLLYNRRVITWLSNYTHARPIDQIQLETIDLSTRLWWIPTICGVYFSEPRADVFCFMQNYNISSWSISIYELDFYLNCTTRGPVWL